MFDYVPEMFAGDHAETIEESDQWVEEGIGKLATVRRPPELLTRDVVAKAINSKLKQEEVHLMEEHSSIFRTVAKKHIEELPSMHHQFKELAGVDISKEPRKLADCALRYGWCFGRRRDSRINSIRLFACGEVASVCMEPTD